MVAPTITEAAALPCRSAADGMVPSKPEYNLS
jgi:hypothetical protein